VAPWRRAPSSRGGPDGALRGALIGASIRRPTRSAAPPPLLPAKLAGLLDALPALRALRAAFPAHELTLALPRWLGPLAQHAGLADSLVETDGRLGPLRLPRRPEIAVDLLGQGWASRRALLGTEPRRLIGLPHPEPRESTGVRWRRDGGPAAGAVPGGVEPSDAATRWCEMLERHGIPADPDQLAITPPGHFIPSWVTEAMIIHPGSADSPRWPSGRFAALARMCCGGVRDVGITGAPAELDFALEIAARADLEPGHVLPGRTSLLGLVDVVAAAGCLVGGSRGAARLAVAVGTPAVLLCATHPPTRRQPAGEDRYVVLSDGREAARTGVADPSSPTANRAVTGRVDPSRPTGERVDPGLLEISVTEVLDALGGLSNWDMPDWRSSGSRQLLQQGP
jgi:hypothetical protein